MPLFDHYIIVDWSAASAPTPQLPTANAIWVGEASAGQPQVHTQYFRTRHACLSAIRNRLAAIIAARERVLLGFDFCYTYPSGTATALHLPTHLPPWHALWQYWHELITDTADNANNRWTVAAQLNQHLTGGPAPFWGCPRGASAPTLTARRTVDFPVVAGGQPLAERRIVDQQRSRLQPVWKLAYPASVGSQTLLGIPYLYQLRFLDDGLRPHSRLWPLETGFGSTAWTKQRPLILHAEIWPSVVPLHDNDRIRDRAQVRRLASYLAELDAQAQLAALFDHPPALSRQQRSNVLSEEGWILGI